MTVQEKRAIRVQEKRAIRRAGGEAVMQAARSREEQELASDRQALPLWIAATPLYKRGPFRTQSEAQAQAARMPGGNGWTKSARLLEPDARLIRELVGAGSRWALRQVLHDLLGVPSYSPAMTSWLDAMLGAPEEKAGRGFEPCQHPARFGYPDGGCRCLRCGARC